MIALGHHRSGLFSANNDALAADLTWRAGDAAARPVPGACRWMTSTTKQLKSNFADMANVGGARRWFAITAAMFLKRFTARSTRLGAPGHCRHGLEVGRCQGRHRPAGAAADALRAGSRRLDNHPVRPSANGAGRVPHRRGRRRWVYFACRLLRKAYRQGARCWLAARRRPRCGWRWI